MRKFFRNKTGKFLPRALFVGALENNAARVARKGAGADHTQDAFDADLRARAVVDEGDLTGERPGGLFKGAGRARMETVWQRKVK